MKVYRIRSDIENYQYFLTKNENEALQLVTDCSERLHLWNPPSVYIYEPLLDEGDFYSFTSGSLIFSPSATAVLQTHLEMAGELLPLPFESHIYTLLNVTVCINCLDYQKSEWRTEEQIGIPTKYGFHADRFPESNLFKIPETNRADVLVIDRENGEGFIHELKENKIRGYKLEHLWSD